jgi:hypothetical protein
MKTYFYDEQIRRFILQFVRMFSHYQVEFGKGRDGTITLYQVPVRYGDSSRQAAAIMKHNSENGIPTAPLMTVHIADLQYDRDRMQQPSHIDKINVRTRAVNENTGAYTQQQGEAYTIERAMPTPYRLNMNVDIWTTNTEQKLQLLEQILTLFNPDMEIQSTDNYIDWTSLSYVELTGQTFTSRSIPTGTDDQIDIATLNFSMPIWLSIPAKVKKLGVIRSIVSGIHDNSGTIKDLDIGLLYGDRVSITPNQYGIILLNGQAQLIDSADAVNNVTTGTSTVVGTSAVGPRPNWQSLIDNWGKLTTTKKATLANGTSQLRVSLTSEIDSTEVVGTVALHPTDNDILLFTVDTDTIPTNTLSAIDAIVDPSIKGPGSGLSASANGQRYLIIKDIGATGNTDGADAWKGAANEDLIASANDIIEYNSNKWQVVYDASTKKTDTDYLTNSITGIQYKWDGSKWIKSYEGEYKAGRWRLVL